MAVTKQPKSEVIDTLLQDFIRNLQKTRKRQRLSLKELSDKIHKISGSKVLISSAKLCRIEKHSTRLTVSDAYWIMKALGLSQNKLLIVTKLFYFLLFFKLSAVFAS